MGWPVAFLSVATRLMGEAGEERARSGAGALALVRGLRTSARDHKGRYGVGTTCAMPGRLVAPGPGRSTTAFTVPFTVAGMQKTAPLPGGVRRGVCSVAGVQPCARPAPRGPLAEGAGGALARAEQPVRGG